MPAKRINVHEVREMVGELVWSTAKGRGRAERVALGPLTALRWTVHAPEGMARWRAERRLRRAERALVAAGVGRVVLRPDFPCRELLRVLRPVDVLPFWREAADVLALGALAAQGVEPRRGRVALSAPRLCPELIGAARRLCPQVRGLLIDAPGGGEYARRLQKEFGLPVTPPAAGADATVALGPGGGRWGRSVELYGAGSLGGLRLKAEGIDLPADCADQVLALLWERGELKRGTLCARLIDRPEERV